MHMIRHETVRNDCKAFFGRSPHKMRENEVDGICRREEMTATTGAES
jgi:hypothetical protein